MNKRINELAVQAGGIWQGGYVEQANGDSVYTNRKFVSGGDMDVEQFAELIVRECAKVCSDVEDAYGNLNKIDIAVGAGVCASEIKEHFGVDNE